MREVKQAEEVTLVHCSSEDQLADILTKPLGKMKFNKLRYDIRVRNMGAKEECCEMANHALENTHGKQTTQMAKSIIGKHIWQTSYDKQFWL